MKRRENLHKTESYYLGFINIWQHFDCMNMETIDIPNIKPKSPSNE